MNKLELDIDNLTDEEILQLTNEINNEYETWNVNLDNMINNLSDNNKIFLSTLSE